MQALASQGSTPGVSVDPWMEGYVLLTKATSKVGQSEGVCTGFFMEQKVNMSFSTEGLQHSYCVKHHAALLLLLPQGVLDTI